MRFALPQPRCSLLRVLLLHHLAGMQSALLALPRHLHHPGKHALLHPCLTAGRQQGRAIGRAQLRHGCAGRQLQCGFK